MTLSQFLEKLEKLDAEATKGPWKPTSSEVNIGLMQVIAALKTVGLMIGYPNTRRLWGEK